MQKLQNSTILWNKNGPVSTCSLKRSFLPVKEHFLMNWNREFYVTQLLRVNMGVHLTLQIKKIFAYLSLKNNKIEGS